MSAIVTVKTSGTSSAGSVYVGTTEVAIQEAIDYVKSQGGGSVFIEAGRYLIANPITVDFSNIEICGEGFHTKLINNATVDGALRVSGTSAVRLAQVYIHDLFIGNDTDTLIGRSALKMAYVGTNAINEYSLIENLYLYNNNTDSVYLDFCTNVTVRECTIRRYNNNAITVKDSKRINLVENIIIEGQGTNVTSGIRLSHTNTEHITIESNVIHGVPGATVYSNSTYDTSEVKNNSISFNILSFSSWWYGVYLTNSAGYTIHGNAIGQTYQDCIRIDYKALDITLTGNSIYGTHMGGVSFGSASKIMFIGNNIQGSYYEMATQYAALVMVSTTTNVTLLGNRHDGITQAGSGHVVQYNVNQE